MIGLVSCSDQKLGHPAPARELYCSTLFKLALRYAEMRCERVYVISAKHGLVKLDQVLEPYDAKMPTNRRVRERWGQDVTDAIERIHGRCNLLVLAGVNYESALLYGCMHWRRTFEAPLRGKQIGQRLSWLSEVCANTRYGTCPHEPCGARVLLNAEGYISFHDFPVPCRAICPGAGYSSVEDVETANAK